MNKLIVSTAQRIQIIRGQKVLIDTDLAELYGVSTKHLNQQIKRNKGRFPADFIFQLTTSEKSELVTNCDRFNKLKYSSSMPYVFTEHGVVMAANLLNSRKAIEMSVQIVRIFMKMKQSLQFTQELSDRLQELESKVDNQDQSIAQILQALQQLITPVLPIKRRKIGL